MPTSWPPPWPPPAWRSPASSIRGPRRVTRRGCWSPACRFIPAMPWLRRPAAPACAGCGCARSAAAAPPGPLSLALSRRAARRAFVDLHNDVTVADIALAAREGYQAVEHVKRYTTLGMGTDQGKTGNVAGLAILAAATGRDIAGT